MNEETNETVAEAATETGAIDTGDTVVIGLIDRPDGPRAMLRYPDGEIDTVAPGDLTRTGRIIAIDTEQVIVADSRGQQTLTMPTTG
ncbi:hypothetical protein OG2516_04723 [Oceanicola granulosus HTCC2516]|uniref:Uncharacterized protein n=1 Tax=Oceanicola granulosus (strain ATCC BAA-861 / DSM 15982 / KCTC 12143 / HTCC2516) TaxID=314256 RepID=Q2CAR6_OCEGH|nr:hypothetical protein [Oceanicola granulosus]EAR49772.1 hypothetical protein OG2516_04723 [Oceanicola granulosus HTCC2516]